MKIRFHPEFWNDLGRIEADYSVTSVGLAKRFRGEVIAGVNTIKTSPGGAGHYLNTGLRVVREFRRRNLKAFPFFILYGFTGNLLIFGSVIPHRSDPLSWLVRFPSLRP